ncbi:YtzC family protein [Bacillus sp. T33-2]|uniref:YtzC family protein n=1 Tax=Bacillus sp. T33-2 TaxID=2054168 RepID=UPI000C77242D|nr:YtzC family protein [Bacillus sp. T33-2]PLR98218.1 DUF2524 domain-containing protein [Bacillus sp. T33-2]
MATRQSVDDLLHRCDLAIQNAEEEYNESSRQEQYNGLDYTDTLQTLEAAYNDLTRLAASCNAEQRDRLHRMRLRLQQTQNRMILLDQ